jgi:gliding motility-associated-like protein
VRKFARPGRRLPLHKIGFYFALLVLFYLLATAEADAQWVSGYTYKSKITLNGSQICGTGTHTNFPVLIQLTANFLKTAPTGLVTSTNGYDIIFTAADQTTILSHQLDYYNSATGTYSAWVNVPSLTGGADTDVYMYYGNASVVADQSSTATWNASYRTVYHFENNSFADATANAINATDNGSANIAAKIGEGRDLDGVSAYIQSASNDLATANNFTLSAWFKADATTPGHILWQGLGSENGWGNGVGGAQEMNVSMGTCCPAGATQNNELSFFLGDREEQSSPDGMTAETPFTNTTNWQHVVATMSNLDTSPVAQLFLNGALIATNTGVTGPITARNLWNTNLRIGRPGAATRFFNGQVDEVRVANTVRSADWICTEYNNQNTPSAFVSLTLHAPVLAAIEGAALSFAEDAAASAITSTLAASDWDDALAQGATIQITSNYVNGEDVLSFTNAFGITGTFNAGTGTLTLAGSATVADYQAALRTVAYQNTNTGNPSTLARTVSFRLNDGNANSAAVTRNINVTTSNDAPVLANIEAAALAFSEGQGATAVSASLTASDVDNANLTSATVQITGNYSTGQDVLVFTAAMGITSSFAAVTGTLTLSGSSSVANYQTALRSVTYNNSSPTPSTLTRTVTFRINDGALNSNTVTRDISVTAVNTPPALAAMEVSALTFTEGAASIQITNATTVVDLDNTTITGATVQVTGNYLGTEDVLSFTNAFGITGAYDATTGTMTLTGVTTLGNYQSALRAVRYQNTNPDNPSSVARTVTFRVNDGASWSNTVTRNINITPVNDAPVLANIELVALAYSEGQAATNITASITTTDVDNANLSSATIQITAGFSSGQDVLAFAGMPGITGSFSGSTLTLTGVATVADYQAALQLVTYRNSNNNNPSAVTRTVTFRVNDGAANSNTVSRNIAFTAVNDAPVLASTESTAATFTEGGSVLQVTNTTTVVDVDSNVTGATIQITGNYLSTEDVLTYVAVPGITGTFDVTTGTMTLAGTAAASSYQTAIRNIRYQNTNVNNPSTLQRTVSFMVTDGIDNSNTVARNINVNGTNDAPVLAGIEGTPVAYTENDAPTAITSAITVTDVDLTNQASATVQITTNYANGQDVLAFATANGISATFTAGTGVLTLTGSASIANYEAALRSVTYENTNHFNPSVLTRTVVFRINDGTVNSNTVTRTITLAPVNDAPVLASIEGTSLAYSEGMAATSVTTTTTAADDSPTLTGAVVKITTNFVNTEDVLSFTNTASITGAWDATTGTMTLTGTTTVSNYQNALRVVRYRNTNNATPSPVTRTVSYTVNDGTFNSNTVTRNIAVTPVNDAPTAVADPVSMNEDTTLDIFPLTNDTDVDDAIDPTSVILIATPANGTATLDATTGKITYVPNANFSGTNVITYTVKDMTGATSNVGTITITVNNINDAPTFIKGADVTTTEDAGAQTIPGWATALNDGDPFTTQSLSFVITSDNSALFSSGPSISGSTGQLTFTTANNKNGIANVTVILKDNGSGTAPNINVSAPQTFVITVYSVNDAPVAVADFYSTSSNTALSSNAQDNDSDPEGNTRTYSPAPTVSPAHGTVVIQPTGTFTYTPDGSFTGTDTFSYEVCDNGTNNGVPAPLCSTAQVTVTINPPNAFYNIVGNNSIQLSTHCFILTQALNNQQGAVWNRFPLDLRYSFELNFDAMFSDTLVVHDDGADGIVFTLQRDDTPPPLNTPGSPIDARGSVGEYLGIGGVSPSLGIEVDTYQNAGEPAFDHIAISRDGSVYNIVSAPVAAKEDGTGPLNIEDGLTHTVRIFWDRPASTLRVFFDGVERTTYTADIATDIFGGDPTNIYWGFSSSTGGKNNYQAVCGIDMDIMNEMPVTTADLGSMNEDAVLNGAGLMANDSDPEQGTLVVTAETKATAHGTVTISGNGAYTYTPNKDYTGNDSFTYQVCDNFSTPGCSIGTVTLTIDPVNDAPTAFDDTPVAAEDTPMTIDVLANDIDIDDAIDITTVAMVANPSHGTVSVNATTGEVMYTPAADFFGTDSFTYSVKDGAGATSNTATVTITVSPVNDAPVAVADVWEAVQATPTEIAVLNNDHDIDSSLDPASVTLVTNPMNGTVTVNTTTGVVIYTSAATYLGADSFTYTVNDVQGLTSNTVTVTISVVPPNQPPMAVDDGPVTHASVLPVTIDVLSNDSDVDNTNDELTIISVTQPAVGFVTLDGRQLIYQPAGTESGTITFTYTIADPDGLTSTATVTIEYTYMPLTVSQGFSPNGDNNNDYWYIRSIESFPKNSLKVFDRWGILVYQTQHYDNLSVAWNGRANTGQQSGSLVDQGTYFYLLDLGDESKKISGYVVIVH